MAPLTGRGRALPAACATALALVLALPGAGRGQTQADTPLRVPRNPGESAGVGSRSPANELTRPALAVPADLTTPNYGKPRKRPDPRSKYAGARKPPGRPLPDLQSYPTVATARQPRNGAPVPRTAPPPPTVATVATIPVKRRPPVEADPFAPVGVGVGSLRLVPYVEALGGYDSNPNRVTAPTKGSGLVRGELGVTARSDWSVHEFKGDLRLGYSKYFDAPQADRPDGQAKLTWRLDATRDTAFDLELRGQLDTQRPGSPDLTPTGIRSRPLVTSLGATAGGAHRIGDLELSLHGTLDRTMYEDATLNSGAKLTLARNSYNTYGLRGRVAYQVTPGVRPFLEAGADLRRRDQSVDSNGYARDSAGVSARAGSSFELTRQLTGEVAAGYAERAYSDKRLANLSGPTFDASLVWIATPLTTVSLRGSTAFSETTIVNASGAVNRSLTLDISHALMRNLTISAVGTVGVNDYKGVNTRENTLSAGVKAEYKLNRSLSVRGSFTHERLHSTTPGSDYTANVFLLGLRFQR